MLNNFLAVASHAAFDCPQCWRLGAADLNNGFRLMLAVSGKRRRKFLARMPWLQPPGRTGTVQARAPHSDGEK